MNKNDRTLKLGVNVAEDAVGHSLRKLEALSFALIIKMHFVNSQYYKTNKTYAEISKICQISTKKAKRVLDDIIAFGYATMAENGITLNVHKIYSEGELCFRLRVNDFLGKKVNATYVKKNDTDKECISLQYVVDEIRKLVIQSHIQRKNFISDTKKGYADAKTLSEAKRFSKRIKKYAISETIDVVNNGISIDSFMNVINVKRRNKVKYLLDQLVFDKLIERTKNIIYIGKCKLNTFYQSDEFGCFFSFNNNLYLKNRNEYSLNKIAADRICF